uniref:CNH domain-containing protein n=1 Tax=Ascaris lumbricoides TaxID=6252 RepID=A0A0M3IHY5_ASCLU
MHITDFVDYICPISHRTCSSKFPKLLLRSDNGLNTIFDLLANATIASLVGPKKGANSLLALMLYGNEAILLSNDEENDETQLCKSVRSTGVDPLDFRITRCWPIRLPLDISKARELAHFTIIRLSPTDFAVVTSTTRNHHILWNLRFFELVDSDAIMLGDLSSASYACTLATDVVVQVSADGRFVVVEFIMQSARQLQLARYFVRVPKLRTMLRQKEIHS